MKRYYVHTEKSGFEFHSNYSINTNEFWKELSKLDSYNRRVEVVAISYLGEIENKVTVNDNLKIYLEEINMNLLTERSHSKLTFDLYTERDNKGITGIVVCVDIVYDNASILPYCVVDCIFEKEFTSNNLEKAKELMQYLEKEIGLKAVY